MSPNLSAFQNFMEWKELISLKDYNDKSGHNPRAWSYMEIMESLLGERLFMSPPAITSSSDTHLDCSKSNNKWSPTSSANASSDVNLSNPNPRKQEM